MGIFISKYEKKKTTKEFVGTMKPCFCLNHIAFILIVDVFLNRFEGRLSGEYKDRI